jgi:hypothetical protein
MGVLLKVRKISFTTNFLQINVTVHVNFPMSVTKQLNLLIKFFTHITSPDTHVNYRVNLLKNCNKNYPKVFLLIYIQISFSLYTPKGSYIR